MRSVNWWNVLWIILAASAAFALSYFVGFNPIRLTIDEEAGQVWPAWLQAAGSIIGLGVAIAVPNVIHNREQKATLAEKRRREKSFILSILPAIQEMQSRLRQARWQATPTTEPPEGPFYGTAARLLEFPADLKSVQLQLFEAGKVSESLYTALSKVPDIQQILNYADHYQTSNGMQWDENADDLIEMPKPDDVFAPIDAAIELLESAINEMKQALS